MFRSKHVLSLALFFSFLLTGFSGESFAERLGVVKNDGRGGGYRRGGTYLAVKLDRFGPQDTIGFNILTGNFKYWTIHARYNGGFWKTVYKGPRNFVSMTEIYQKIRQLRKGQPTHLNFSVNGAHERYEPVACQLAIVRRGSGGHHGHHAKRGGIHIVAGTYGKNCGSPRGNKSRHLKQACEGKRDCVYVIDHRVIGDPNYGCGKNYIAEWRCGNNPHIHRATVAPEAGYRKKVRLVCGHGAPPPHVGHRPPMHHPPRRPQQSLRIFKAVHQQSSSNFRHSKFQKMSVSTRRFDAIPYHVAPPSGRMITLRPGQRCFLAGNAAGTAGFYVDNFILMEVKKRGHRARYAIGNAEPLTYRGQRVQHLGAKKFSFGAGEIDITNLLPKNRPTLVQFYALDYGSVGKVSDLFVIIR